ncbi:MAG: DUF1232 domain-containing protein [Chloroflexi bacterium]|nr:DUF1232 domain-containing protein [Chloroflexota bacterium]MBI3338638.1 DUF1232 domain-containing protein [Chloroflexota bacterium]
MADKKDMIIPRQGFLRGVATSVKLTLRLLGDRRVSFWTKLIPIGALAYWIWPFDLIPGIPGLDAVDDVAVLSLGYYLFIELSPQDVVQEHMKKLAGNSDIADGQDDVVDADSVEIKEGKQ